MFPQSAMQPVKVVFRPPRFDIAPGVGDGQDPMCVQTLIAQFAVERLDEAVFHRSSRV